MAQRILAATATRNSGTLGLILVPTRELARQVLKHCRQLLAKSPLEAQAITGGADFKYQKSLLRKNPEILIATPGRLLEHCEKGSADLRSLQTLVLDEADRMLDMGFREDVLKIAAYCSPARQVLMLSATLRAQRTGRRRQGAAQGSARGCHWTGTPAAQQYFPPTHPGRQPGAQGQTAGSAAAAGGYQRALVFANKRIRAKRLAGLLDYHKLRCDCLHGEMSTEERKRVMTRFNDGKLDILCASDVAARGLDVKDIDLVVNYDMPHSGDDYLHRTGRTGRAGAHGLAVSLVNASEWNLMISIQRYLKLEFEPRKLAGLKARYSGPKKTKSSGKAAGKKKKSGKSSTEKSKSRDRNRKNRGKPDSGDNKQTPIDGFAPLMKKKKQD